LRYITIKKDIKSENNSRILKKKIHRTFIQKH